MRVFFSARPNRAVRSRPKRRCAGSAPNRRCSTDGWAGARHDPASLQWHPDRSGELAGTPDRAGIDGCTGDATSGSIAEIASAVLTAVRWG
ncbi:hypothetical protein [Streptomyces virginiae]|uniref:hypothetical protein n=1 Tax=Streptomyces virginiae TaxID=1961 RepID=UPI00342BFFA8